MSWSPLYHNTSNSFLLETYLYVIFSAMVGRSNYKENGQQLVNKQSEEEGA